MKTTHFARSRAFWLSLLLMCFSTAPISAQGFEYEFGLFTHDGGGTITGYSRDAVGPVDIPSEINGIPVTSIVGRSDFLQTPSAFGGHTGITSVTIPEGVTTIGNFAFSYCTGLTSVTIPSSVTSIGRGAFAGCSALTSVIIPSKVTKYWDDVWVTWFTGAFSGCTGLTSVTFEQGLTTIGPNMFQGCTGITSVTIPDSVTSIGGEAFRNCSGMTSVSISSRITRIEGSTFRGCSGLTSLNLSRVSTIGKDAFEGCTGLTSLTIPESVTSIDVGAFASCSALHSAFFLHKTSAPWILQPFKGTAPDFTIYYFGGTTGFDRIAAGVAVAALSVADVLIPENAGTAEVVISSFVPTENDVRVDYTTGSLTAIGGVDFTSSAGTAVIPAGQSQVSVFIPIEDDILDEQRNETFFFSLTNPVGIVIRDGSATITIMENDVAVLSVENLTVEETVGTAQVTVRLSNPSVSSVSFSYTLIDATATAGEDYTASIGNMTIPGGGTTAIIPVGITDDNSAETDEVFEVALSNVTGVTAPVVSGLVTIIDNEAAGLSIADVRVDEWAGTVTIAVSMSGPTQQAVTFDFRTEPGSATPNEDYLPITGAGAIPSGATETSITISILDDNQFESSETLTVVLSNVSGASVIKATGVVTITDGGPGYDGWVAAQGLTENGGFSEDASGDGFSNGYHYAMQVPVTASLVAEYPSLVPRIDTNLFGNKAALVFGVPVDSPDDIILEVEESLELKTWKVIATKDGTADWSYNFPNVVIQGSNQNGYRETGVTATNAFNRPTPGFYRLNVRLR